MEKEKKTVEAEVAQVKAGAKQYTSEAYGHMKIFTPDFIQNIVSRIQAAETEAPVVEETVWSKRLAAKAFAQELLDTAVAKKQAEKCRAGIKQAAEISKEKETVAYLENVDVHFLDKVNLLKEKMDGKNSLVMNLVYQLITEGTLTMLPDIAEEYEHLYNNISGSVNAQVVAAVSLDEEERAKISKRLAEITGKKITLEVAVDPSIIGGIIIRIGDKLIDGSLRGKLEAMHKDIAGL